jgi:hypothetical protein
MSFICEFCSKEFTIKGNLLYHQKTAKYCIKIQGKEVKDEFICFECNKTFLTKFSFTRHIKLCQEKIETEQKEKSVNELNSNILKLKSKLESKDEYISKLEEKIEKLENHIIKLSEKPTHTTTTTNNNQRYQQQIIQNLIPILDEHYEQIRDNLTEEHIKRGADGYADVTYDFMKDKIACTDFSRRILTYKDEKGNIIKDPKMNVFAKKIFTYIQPKCDELTQTCVNKIVERLSQATQELCIDKETMDDNDILIFERETDKILDEKKELIYIKNDINEIVQGKDNSLKSKYIEKICNKVYNR